MLSDVTLDEPFELGAARRRWLREGHWGHPKLTAALDLWAAEFPDKDAIVDPRGTRVTYGELRRQVDRLAGSLRKAGLEKGDVVSIQLPNWIEYCVAHLALVRAGMVTLFLHPGQRANELRYVFEKARPKAMIFPAEHRGFDFVDMYKRLRGDAVCIVAATSGGRELGSTGLAYVDLLADGLPMTVDEPVELDDPELMVFSSGTSAEPKGVVHRYGTANHGLHVWQQLLSLGHEDTVFAPATLGHVGGGQWALRVAMLIGAKLVLMDRWDPAEAVEVIERERCTYTLVTPTFVEDVIAHARPRPEALASFRWWVVGGARIRPGLAMDLEDIGAGRMLRGFGMSEHFMSSLCRPYDPLDKRMHTDGRPLPGCAYRVVDPGDSRITLMPGEVGELAYRGPALVEGYFTSDEETRKAFVDGWQLTGDLATLDTDGFMTIVDRKKDIIVRGGENISPLELENILFRHPDIDEVTVVGYEDDRLGERVCAVVVPAANGSVSLESIARFLAEHEVAPYKFPERLEVIEMLPRTSLGKVAKRTVERWLATGETW